MKKFRRRILVALPLALALLTGAASTASAIPGVPDLTGAPCVQCIKN